MTQIASKYESLKKKSRADSAPDTTPVWLYRVWNEVLWEALRNPETYLNKRVFREEKLPPLPWWDFFWWHVDLIMAFVDVGSDVMFAAEVLSFASPDNNNIVFFVCSLVFLLIPMFINGVVTLAVIANHDDVDSIQIREKTETFIPLFILICTNSSLISILPWSEHRRNSWTKPTTILLFGCVKWKSIVCLPVTLHNLAFITLFFEDLPQIIIQGWYLLSPRSTGEKTAYTFVSWGLSLFDIFYQILKLFLSHFFSNLNDKPAPVHNSEVVDEVRKEKMKGGGSGRGGAPAGKDGDEEEEEMVDPVGKAIGIE